MSLKKLIEENKTEENSQQNKPLEEKDGYNRVGSGDIKELRVRSDDSHINPIDCTSCDGGVSVPIMYYDTAYGSTTRCTNIFCSNSIFAKKVPNTDFEKLLKLQNDMVDKAREYREEDNSFSSSITNF